LKKILFSVMAGLVPAIHALLDRSSDVDARDKPGHDGLCEMAGLRPYQPGCYLSFDNVIFI
jgi:hypothetical protein